MLEWQQRLFFQFSIDRNTCSPILKYSKLGGLKSYNIENLHPDDMKSIPIDFLKNVDMSMLLDVAVDLGIEQQKS